MSLTKTLRKNWVQIPSEVRRLILIALILIGIWKILYTFWLAPKRVPDAALTELVARQTVFLMKVFWPRENYNIIEKAVPHKGDEHADFTHLFIYQNDRRTISIADNCNGLELMILYAAFILIMPGNMRRKAAFLAMGIPLLHIANLLRCMGLILLYQYWPDMFDIGHHYVFKIMVYGISFGLWMWYLKPLNGQKKENG
jgi:exosortase family protein XrtF